MKEELIKKLEEQDDLDDQMDDENDDLITSAVAEKSVELFKQIVQWGSSSAA